MTRLALVVASLLALPLQAEDECSFDQENQLKVVASVAASLPGGVIDAAGHLVTWSSRTQDITTFGYGGCADLGSVVTRSTVLPAPRTQKQVLVLARQLAEQFWNNKATRVEPLAAEALVRALEQATFTERQRLSSALYEVNDPSYVQLYVEHSYDNGIDRVAIAWQGNY